MSLVSCLIFKGLIPLAAIIKKLPIKFLPCVGIEYIVAAPWDAALAPIQVLKPFCKIPSPTFKLTSVPSSIAFFQTGSKNKSFKGLLIFTFTPPSPILLACKKASLSPILASAIWLYPLILFLDALPVRRASFTISFLNFCSAIILDNLVKVLT